MRVRPKWLKDLAGIVFTVYYLVCAEQADEKVRKVRGELTLEHLRVSWNKPTTPYISFFTKLMRPKLMRYPPRAIRIPRPSESSYSEPVQAWLYFDGPISALKDHDKIVLDIPGGGFVAMDPRGHEDKLLAWAGRTGVPLLALDYKKAPEFPYPYALNECYDVYHTLVATKGRCIGLGGIATPKIIVSGDSAGGNLAVSLILMILQSGSTEGRRWNGENALPPPEGAVLVYPALDMNIGNWMTDEQMALIKDRKTRKTNKGILSRKSDDYRKLTPNTPLASDGEDDESTPPKASRTNTALETITDKAVETSPERIHTSAAHTVDTGALAATTATSSKPQMLRTRLAMSSMISYFNDRIISPEMMRAMIILYIGPHSRPDFSTDYLLSPLLAPEALLSRFPKTYILTGERDPLVDDTVIFAGRLRQAKAGLWRERKELGLVREKDRFLETDHVNVVLIPGISHGFLQFVSVFPEGWKYIFRCAKWMREIFHDAEMREQDEAEDDEEEEALREAELLAAEQNGTSITDQGTDCFGNHIKRNGFVEKKRHHHRTFTESSGDEDRPLTMSSVTSNSPRSGANGLRGRRARGNTGSAGGRPSARRNKSLISLASEDDLLARRMKGLTGALMGGDRHVPGTP